MRPSLDPYLEPAGKSLLHRRDPRAKLLVALVLILSLVLTPSGRWLAFGMFGLLAAVLLAVSRVPRARLLRRAAMVLPFVLPAVLFLPFLRGGDVLWQVRIGGWHIIMGCTGLALAVSIMLKSVLSALVLGVLVATTRIADLLGGLDKLGAPRLLTALFGLTYRYLFVLEDEAFRLKAGRDVRYRGGMKVGISSAGHMAGSLFLRSYNRAERVYGAMLLRGYDGIYRSRNPLRADWADIMMVAVASSIAISITLAARWL